MILPRGTKVEYTDPSLNSNDLNTLLRSMDDYSTTVVVNNTTVRAKVLSVDGDVMVNLENKDLSRNSASMEARMSIQLGAETSRILAQACHTLSGSALGPDVEIWQLVSWRKMQELIPGHTFFGAPKLIEAALSDTANFETLKQLCEQEPSWPILLRVVCKISTYI